MTPALFAELQRRHAEPHRAHHDWARVAGMLAMAEDVSHAIAGRAAFILAVLFHSAVFDRTRSDNAAASVALMHERLGATMPPGMLARAEALIEAVLLQDLPRTADASLRGDAALLLDMDNAVLGAPAARYDAYEAAIRREYAHLPDDCYWAGRATALRMLLWRDRIYRTDRCFLAQEKRARRNIEATIERLETP
jgi:predicted metal-dependent HD superfamily phosphohydrolase